MKITFTQRLMICFSLAAASTLSCKPRQDDSALRSYQSLHKGGITLLWYGEAGTINVCALSAPLANVPTIESLAKFTEHCNGGKSARISNKEFATMSSEFLTNTTFKSLIRGQEVSKDYAKYAERATTEKDLIKQTSAVALIMSQLEALEYQLSKSQSEFDSMESFLAQTSKDNQRPTDAQIAEIYGDTYKKVKLTVDELNKKRPLLDTNLQASSEILSKAVEEFLLLRTKFEGRISTLITEIFAKELHKSSLLFENSIDYALFSNVAVQLGIIDGGAVGVVQTPANADLAKLSCQNEKQKYVLRNPKLAIDTFESIANCEATLITYRRTGMFCSDSLKTVNSHTKMYGEPFNSFEICDVAAGSATKGHVCAPSTNSFNAAESGIFVWSLIDQSKGNKFESSPDGLKQCIEHISRLAQVEVVATLFKAELFNNLVKTPTSASTPSPSQAGTAKPAQPTTPGQPAQPTKPTQPTVQAPSGPSLTPVPETLATNSELAVDDIVEAMKNAKKFFKVDDATRDGCLQATMSSASPWSDIMAHYYCQFPIMDASNTASVRACFTGTLRGQGGYPKKDDFRAAFDQCINRMEFNWIRSNSLIQFQYIMMSQRDIKDAGKLRFSLSSQREALDKFYGGTIPVRRP